MAVTKRGALMTKISSARIAFVVSALTASIVVPIGVGNAAEIKILSSVALKSILTDHLIPQFEASSGNKVVANFGSSASVKQQINGGEAFDLVVLSPAGVIDDFVKSGMVATDAYSNVGRIGVGVAIKAGAPRPDISSVDAFKRTLINAKSIALVDPATGGAGAVYFMSLAQRLGIVDEIKPKLKLTPPGESGPAVAAGEAELGIGAVSEIVTVRGAELLGPFPTDAQSYTAYAAGVSAKAKEPAAARAILKFITAPAAASVLKAGGMDPG
jgi:molybdate transport system substrate-binding protein